MEVVGAFFDEEWELLSKMFSCGENPNLLFPSNGEIPSENIPFDHHPNFYCISEESSNASDQVERALFPTDHEFLDHDNVPNNNTFEAMNFHNHMDISNNDHGMMMMMMPVFSDDVMEEILYSKDEENDHQQPSETGDSCKEMQLKRKSKDCSPQISPKKTPRVSRNKNQSKKKKKMVEEEDNEEERNGTGSSGINMIRQSSSSTCSSEDDSQELINGGSLDSDTKALNSNGKSKKTRGSATDPQSLYARRRREKINERLKILQNLVPNGTKVDISTMLEEAVTYVKFLQLQIKLLSSDDLWMYAPLAYNGMDIGIYQNISPNLRV